MEPEGKRARLKRDTGKDRKGGDREPDIGKVRRVRKTGKAGKDAPETGTRYPKTR